jgi:hypothetical protein
MKTIAISMDDLMRKIEQAKLTARNNGQFEQVYFKTESNGIRIFTVPGYSELNPELVCELQMSD